MYKYITISLLIIGIAIPTKAFSLEEVIIYNGNTLTDVQRHNIESREQLRDINKALEDMAEAANERNNYRDHGYDSKPNIIVLPPTNNQVQPYLGSSGYLLDR